MSQPHTLHEYIELRNLQRKRQNYFLNEGKDIPNIISLDKEKKIDSLILDILDYIRRIIGDGPIFNRFKGMMQNLHKTFEREMSEFHHISVANKLKKDEACMQEMRKANLKLNQYLKKCEQDNQLTAQKLEKLAKSNKQQNVHNIFITKNAVKNHVDDFKQQQFQKPQKIVKIGRIDFSPVPEKTAAALILPAKNENLSVKLEQPKPTSRISSFFGKI